jgi:hypothetical protein
MARRSALPKATGNVRGAAPELWAGGAFCPSTGATKGPPKAKPATNKAATITDRLCIQPVPDTKVHRERI